MFSHIFLLAFDNNSLLSCRKRSRCETRLFLPCMVRMESSIEIPVSSRVEHWLIHLLKPIIQKFRQNSTTYFNIRQTKMEHEENPAVKRGFCLLVVTVHERLLHVGTLLQQADLVFQGIVAMVQQDDLSLIDFPVMVKRHCGEYN